MDTSIIFVIIIATVAILPGIAGVIHNLTITNREQRIFQMETNNQMGELFREALNQDQTKRNIQKETIEKPIAVYPIIRCIYCKSGSNTRDNLFCTQCGAPLRRGV